MKNLILILLCGLLLSCCNTVPMIAHTEYTVIDTLRVFRNNFTNRPSGYDVIIKIDGIYFSAYINSDGVIGHGGITRKLNYITEK